MQRSLCLGHALILSNCTRSINVGRRTGFGPRANGPLIRENRLVSKPPLKRVYFDTNILYPWPQIPSDIPSMLGVANWVGAQDIYCLVSSGWRVSSKYWFWSLRLTSSALMALMASAI